jgi:hypothetical protein
MLWDCWTEKRGEIMMANESMNSLLEQISKERLMSHIAEFSRWTKHAGTAEELESLKYVEQEMRSYGYKTELILHDAYISLPGQARVEALGRTFSCIVHSFSASSQPNGTAGRLVYAGAGRPQDYQGIDVRGCIVVLDGIANPAATIEANRRGAIGQIHVSPHEYVHEMCISPVWGSPGDDQIALLPKTVVVTVPFETGEALKRAIAENEVVEAALFAEVDTGWRKTPILVADYLRPGGEPDDPFILFTGHHDTWYYGVMDNGGANATMLEVARLCAQRPDLWQRSLRVIFWSGHSQGRYSSSAWYADMNWEELEQRALVHVNVDSTGGLGNTIVADTTAAAELRGLAQEAISTQSGQVFSGRRMERAGDQSFWGIGVPAIFGNMSEQPAKSGAANASAAVFGGGNRLGHGTGWWWHTPYDTADKIDPENLVRDTRIYQYTVWRLLTDPVLPLDYAVYAEDLISTVNGMQEQVGSRFDLSPVLDRARELKDRVGKLNGLVKQAGGRGELVQRINACLQELSRVLVPLDYTYGDRFVHDPALRQPPVPALSDVPKLANLDPDSAEFKFLASRLVRARNRVAVGLREAIKITDQFLGSL